MLSERQGMRNTYYEKKKDYDGMRHLSIMIWIEVQLKYFDRFRTW